LLFSLILIYKLKILLENYSNSTSPSDPSSVIG